MRKRFALGLALCFSCLFAGGPAGGQEQLAHAIFVKVNDRTITQDNVVQAVRYLIKREYNNLMPEDEEELEGLQRAALRDLVRTILIHDEAGKLGVKPDRNSWKRAMEQSGLTPDEVTPTIRRMLQADDLFDDLMMASGTPIRQPSPREIKDFYGTNREEFRTNAFIIVRTIFIADEKARPQAFYKARAEAIQSEIEMLPVSERTAAFDKTARESSQDIFSEFGGLLTGQSPERWIPKDFNNQNPDGTPIFPQQMVEGIRRLNRKGELRLAVSEDGMHLLYCEDLQGGNVLGWDEAARIIEYVLKQRSRNTAMRNWINRIYDRSDVRWHDGTIFEKELLTEILLPSEHRGQEEQPSRN